MNINIRGELYDLSSSKVMGILNLTPDSFYDGGKYNSVDKAVSRVSEMIKQGVDIIDIGAVSSKPGSKIIKGGDELKLTSKYIIEFSKNFKNVLFSIDTYNSEVAEFALNNGFAIINDISSGKYDSKLIDVVKDYNAGYVIMHMEGDPDNMQKKPAYNNVVDSIYTFFNSKINELESINIKNIIIDPGFGFGKTIDHNFEILSNLEKFKEFKKPLLAGISRKSMIYKFLNTRPDKALNGTSVLNTIALNKGADVLRVHDIIEAKECLALFNKLN